MDTELSERARAALVSWQHGDLSALEALLDPEVELLWWKPGEWDCHGRDAVLALLRDRAQRGAGKAEVDLIETGDALVVSRTEMVTEDPQASTRPATLVTFREGKVISMRQFRGREEALAAAS
jgi:ketosteroid isomerase-like protein